MRKILSAILLAAIISQAASAQQERYAIPVKMWVYGLKNAPSADDVQRTIQNLNNLYSKNATGLSFYLQEIEYIKKKKFDEFGFYSQMPWQSLTRHSKNVLNISLVPRLKKGSRSDNYTGVCFSPTGSVVVAKGEDPSVIAHEVGHALGLGHALDIQDNIMSYNPDKSARVKFMDSQKSLMLKNVAKMKHSGLWKCSAGDPVADASEPDFCRELSAVMRLGAKYSHTFHASVDGKGRSTCSDIDYFKITFKKKELPRQVFLTIKDSGNAGRKASIKVENSKGEQLFSLQKDKPSQVFPMWIMQPDTYYIILENASSEPWKYTLELVPENLGN